MPTTLDPPAAPYLASAAGALALGVFALAATAGSSTGPRCEATAAAATKALTAIIGDESVQAHFLGAPLSIAVDQLATARRYCAYGWEAETTTVFENLAVSIGNLRAAGERPAP